MKSHNYLVVLFCCVGQAVHANTPPAKKNDRKKQLTDLRTTGNKEETRESDNELLLEHYKLHKECASDNCEWCREVSTYPTAVGYERSCLCTEDCPEDCQDHFQEVPADAGLDLAPLRKNSDPLDGLEEDLIRYDKDGNPEYRLSEKDMLQRATHSEPRGYDRKRVKRELHRAGSGGDEEEEPFVPTRRLSDSQLNDADIKDGVQVYDSHRRRLSHTDLWYVAAKNQHNSKTEKNTKKKKKKDSKRIKVVGGEDAE